jgi:hypothetical protein
MVRVLFSSQILNRIPLGGSPLRNFCVAAADFLRICSKRICCRFTANMMLRICCESLQKCYSFPFCKTMQSQKIYKQIIQATLVVSTVSDNLRISSLGRFAGQEWRSLRHCLWYGSSSCTYNITGYRIWNCPPALNGDLIIKQPGLCHCGHMQRPRSRSVMARPGRRW